MEDYQVQIITNHIDKIWDIWEIVANNSNTLDNIALELRCIEITFIVFMIIYIVRWINEE